MYLEVVVVSLRATCLQIGIWYLNVNRFNALLPYSYKKAFFSYYQVHLQYENPRTGPWCECIYSEINRWVFLFINILTINSPIPVCVSIFCLWVKMRTKANLNNIVNEIRASHNKIKCRICAWDIKWRVIQDQKKETNENE